MMILNNKKMKKFVTPLIISALLLTPTTSFAKSDFKVQINGETINFNNQLLNENDRLLIPLEEAIDDLNATANYDAKNNKITIDEKYTSIEFTIGSKTACVMRKYDFSGIPEKVELDVAPVVKNETVYIPLRFTTETLGCTIEWDPKMRTAIINKNNKNEEVNYKIIESEDIKDEELKNWYESNYTEQGIHFYNTINNSTYVIASAGQKPTAGYQTILNQVTEVSPGIINISITVLKPAPDMMVANVITYPHILIEIKEKDIKNVTGTIDIYNSDMSEKDLSYEIISINDVKDNSPLLDWVEKNYKTSGIHYMRDDENVLYALVCAGERNTGGYSVSIGNIVSKKPDEAFIYAYVNSPDPDAMVTQAITYPYAMVKINDANIKHVSGEIKDGSGAIAVPPLDTDKTIKKIGADILYQDVKSAELYSLMGEKLKDFDAQEIKNICEAYNDAIIDDNPYIERLAGNSISMYFKNGDKITFTSYGSKTNVIATISKDDVYSSYHIVCPEIADILMSGYEDFEEVKTINSIGASISSKDVKSAELYNLENEKLRDLAKDELENVIESFNNSIISNDPYILMLAGNTLSISLNDGSKISFTSYGSKTNVIATIIKNDINNSYHIVCPEIAAILLSGYENAADGCEEAKNISSIGASISLENVKSGELYSLENVKLRDLTKEELKKVIESFNNSPISDEFYIMMLTGNTLIINLNGGGKISFTSYGSETNVIANVATKEKTASYHLVCPEIAKILLSK